MKAIIGGAAGVLALGGAVLLANTRTSTNSVQASSPAQTVATPAHAPAVPTLVDCGEGRQALVQPVVPGQQISQVQCVTAPVAVPQAWGQTANYLVAPAAAYPAVQAAPVQERVVYRDRVVYQDRPVRRTVARSRPTYRRAASDSYERPRRMRSVKSSALIIAGSAAGGAGVGAILGGSSGAKKGAVVGGIGGLVYDMATRNKR